MNQVFDFNRWLLLVGKHWNENKRKYLLGLGAVGALIILWYLFMILTNPPFAMRQDVQVITYFVGLFLIGCLYASMWFGELAEAPKGMQYLMVPASTTEKLLTALLYGVVLFFICYTVVFYAADIIMVKVANSVDLTRAVKHHNSTQYTQKVANVFTGPDGIANSELIVYLILIYVAVQAGFLLGSIFFSRYSFIKTAIALLIVFLFFVFYMANVMNSIMPSGHFSETMFGYKVYQGDQEKIVQLPAWIGNIVAFLLKYAFAPIFWVVAYFRLKEKEV